MATEDRDSKLRQLDDYRVGIESRKIAVLAADGVMTSTTSSSTRSPRTAPGIAMPTRFRPRPLGHGTTRSGRPDRCTSANASVSESTSGSRECGSQIRSKVDSAGLGTTFRLVCALEHCTLID